MVAHGLNAFPVGSEVLVNHEVPGIVIDAEVLPGFTVGSRSFVAYLVRFEDGTEEGFGGDYLSVKGEQR